MGGIWKKGGLGVGGRGVQNREMGCREGERAGDGAGRLGVSDTGFANQATLELQREREKRQSSAQSSIHHPGLIRQ